MVKNPTENAHHFLIRVRYVAGLFKEMLTCECPRFTVDVESIARILFLSGLEKWETGKTQSMDHFVLNLFKLLTEVTHV